MVSWYRWDNHDLIIQAKIQPGSQRDEIVGLHGDALKIRITAPPVDGKANKHLIGLLAKACQVKKSKVTIEAGHLSRVKTIRVQLKEQKLPTAFLI